MNSPNEFRDLHFLGQTDYRNIITAAWNLYLVIREEKEKTDEDIEMMNGCIDMIKEALAELFCYNDKIVELTPEDLR